MCCSAMPWLCCIMRRWATRGPNHSWFCHHVCQWPNRKSIISSSNNNILRFGIEWDNEDNHHIVRIDMTANHLDGSIPQELSALTTLKILDLAQNELFGTLPTEISRLTHWEILDWSNNCLTGPVPEEWARLSDLERLHLQVNDLSGSVPTRPFGNFYWK